MKDSRGLKEEIYDLGTPQWSIRDILILNR
jgi:hypothetical protein